MKRLIIKTQSAAQQVVDYVNAVNKVSNYAVQVNTTTLPTLVTPPDHYGNFVDTFALAKLHSLNWINDVMTSFNTLPGAYINFNTLIQAQLNTVLNNLQQLQSHPGDSTAISNIKNAISALIVETDSGIQYMNNLSSWVSNFGNQLQPDAKNLRTLCDQLTEAAGIDKNAVAKLQDVINKLQEMIDLENEIITLDTVGNIMFGIFLTAVGVAIGAPFSGAAAIIVGLLTGIGSTVYTTLDPVMTPPKFAQDQQQLQDEMNLVNTEIGALNTIIGQLQITTNQFENLIKMSSAANQSILPITQFWQLLKNDLSDLVNDLDGILNNLKGDNLNDSILEVQAAQASWNDLENYMTKIKGLKYVLPDKVIMPGSIQN